MTLKIDLPPELDRFVAQRVASGDYETPSEVLLAGLRLLEEQKAEEKLGKDEVRQKIQDGIDQARRGELVDGEEVMRRLKGHT
ncbi:MAG TPA: type II toxin-antitoxin system ParD family antitoxin [Phycisphaerae bacterium]|nr:type II toxin-antitoxin system ParD family antitoxin [Phycisphaerae bacterium]